MAKTAWDTLIKNALVFDGSGAAPQQVDIAIKDGRIAARGRALPEAEAAAVIDGEGQWLMPGLLDIHTHLDLEVDLDPGLSEVVRHGTTTVLVGNCSLGTCFGQQVEGDQNPIVDCFTRVENIPKSVLNKCVEAVKWDNSGDYLDHFSDIPLGPNVAAFVPHSMLRVEVMGLNESISRDPTDAELAQMENLLEQAMGQGYLGMSTDGLPFHYLANEPHTDQRIPTQFASFGEMKRLLKVVRNHNRVWQTTPIRESRQGLSLFSTDQRTPVWQVPEDLRPGVDGIRIGAQSAPGVSGICGAGQYPSAQGPDPLPGTGHQFSGLVRRYRLSSLRGAGVHLQTDRQRI